MANKPKKRNELTANDIKSIFGISLGLLSKYILEDLGYNCNYLINGESIDNIEKLSVLNIQQKLELAIKEERYSDCVILKKLIDSKK